MKKIFILSLFISLSLFASGVKWYHNFDMALSKAKEVHKPILMMYSAKT
jgi:hypothetical protein